MQSNSNEIDEYGCLARPYLNIEYKGVSVETLQSVCPLLKKHHSLVSHLRIGERTCFVHELEILNHLMDWKRMLHYILMMP